MVNLITKVLDFVQLGGPIIPGTGLAFSLRGTQSKLTEGHPAAIAGGKRPRLTPAPALVLRDGEALMPSALTAATIYRRAPCNCC